MSNSKREEGNEIYRFFRYNETQQHEHPFKRAQVIPNKIHLSDYSTITPVYQRKKKKFPIFAACKSSPKKKAALGNIFTNRGIIAVSSPLEKQPITSCIKRQIKTHKKAESSLTLFNKLILSPYNFIRPKHPHYDSANNSPTQKKMRLYTPNKYKSQNLEKRKLGRPSEYGRTCTEWTKRSKTEQKRDEKESFIGWQTFSIQGDDFS